MTYEQTWYLSSQLRIKSCLPLLLQALCPLIWTLLGLVFLWLMLTRLERNLRALTTVIRVPRWPLTRRMKTSAWRKRRSYQLRTFHSCVLFLICDIADVLTLGGLRKTCTTLWTSFLPSLKTIQHEKLHLASIEVTWNWFQQVERKSRITIVKLPQSFSLTLKSQSRILLLQTSQGLLTLLKIRSTYMFKFFFSFVKYLI